MQVLRLVPVLLLLASFIQGGVAVSVTCYDCIFLEVNSTDATVNAFLQLATLLNDANCKLNGANYTTATGLNTSSCATGGCSNTNADMNFTVSGYATTMKMWYRGCGQYGEATHGCITDLTPYAANFTAAMGGQNTTITGTACNCMTDRCNISPTTITTTGGASHVTLAAIWMFFVGIIFMFL